jgi:CheY-like chemotaxis protein
VTGEAARARVLVVDDDTSVHDLLSHYLGLAGFEVLHAFTGEEGVEALARETPDVVLLDVQMPGMDGFDTLRRMQETPGGHATPVIYVSSLERSHLKVRGLELGAEDYVTKPFDRAELVARIRAALRRSRRVAPAPVPRALSGQLSEMGLPAVLQAMEGLGRPACVRVPEVGGEVVVRGGSLVRVTMGRHQGAAALDRLFLCARGSFTADLVDLPADQEGTHLGASIMSALTHVDEARDGLPEPLRTLPVVALEPAWAQEQGLPAGMAAAPARLDDVLSEMAGDLRENAAKVAAGFLAGLVTQAR